MVYLLHERMEEMEMKTEKAAKDKKQNGRRIGARCTVAVGIIVLLAAAFRLILFPPYQQPQVTGSYEVEIREYTWEDAGRVETFTDTGENRALTVKFWYPKEEGRYPLVVFSHGAFGVIDSNYSTCMELASNGYVAVSIAHPYHAMYVKDVNGKTTLVNSEFFKSAMTAGGNHDPEEEEKMYLNSVEWMALRTADENFVLDTILDKVKQGEEGPFRLVDPEKIGLFGHSMGGACSVALGREREDIDAVIDLEGTMLGEYVGFENGTEVFNQEPYPIPVLDVNSERVHEEAERLADMGLQYVNFYVGENAADYREVVFRDAGHLNFTDLPLASPVLAKMLGVGKVDARTCIENVNQVVLCWFDYYLKDKGELNLKAVY